MKKTRYDLGDLSFTTKELEELQKAENVERNRSSTAPELVEPNRPRDKTSWWDEWFIKKITAQ